MMPSPKNPSCAKEASCLVKGSYDSSNSYGVFLPEFGRTHGLARHETENQEIGWLEGSYWDVIQVFVGFHHVTADHGPQLENGNAKFFGSFGF